MGRGRPKKNSSTQQFQLYKEKTITKYAESFQSYIKIITFWNSIVLHTVIIPPYRPCVKDSSCWRIKSNLSTFKQEIIPARSTYTPMPIHGTCILSSCRVYFPAKIIIMNTSACQCIHARHGGTICMHGGIDSARLEAGQTCSMQQGYDSRRDASHQVLQVRQSYCHVLLSASIGTWWSDSLFLNVSTMA